MHISQNRLLVAAPALLTIGIVLAGCSHSSSSTPPAAAVQPGAPSSAQVAAQQAMVQQRMSQTREAAIAAWRGSHPGQKLPPGF